MPKPTPNPGPLSTGQFNQIMNVLQDIFDLVTKINQKENQIMAQIDDLNALLDSAGTAIDGVTTSLTQLKTDLDKTLADLAAKIAAGGTPTDLTAVIAKAQAISDKLTPITAALSAIDTETTAADK